MAQPRRPITLTRCLSVSSRQRWPDVDAYDLERVEVLRGPQGTLYGASALNGVVRVLTKDADLDQFELKARGSTSSTEMSRSLNYRGDMAINVPIIEDKLAARAVVGYQSWSGWIDRPQSKDANDAESRNVRLSSMHNRPSSYRSASPPGFHGMSMIMPPTGEETGQSSSTRNEPASTDYDVFGLKLAYDLPSISIAANTSYMDYLHRNLLDLAPFGAPGFHDELRFEATTFAQEVLIQSMRGESWRWSLGSMYRDNEDRISEHLLQVLTWHPSEQATVYASYGVGLMELKPRVHAHTGVAFHPSACAESA